MSDLPEKIAASRPAKTTAERWLRWIGVTVFLLTLLGGGVFSLSRHGGESVQAVEGYVGLAEFALYAGAGLAFGGLLVGLSSLLRAMRDVHASFVRFTWLQHEMKRKETDSASEGDTSSEQLVSDADATDTQISSLEPWREVISLLEDIRDNSLLSNEELVAKRLRVADEELNTAAARIRTLTTEGDFAQTREIAESLVRKYPDDDRAKDLVEQVESSREKHEFEDVQSCTKQVEDLISISAWSRARNLAHQLQQKHPDSVEARQLLLRIEREHRVFEEEQKRRMSAEVQRYVSRRRWEEALAAARTLIERFPGSEDAESVRMQLPTLEANAEIEIRQHLEARIMEYVRQGRYIEAVELAKIVIERYPDSPQAEALRAQLERLQELAENPDAAPARVKTDS